MDVILLEDIGRLGKRHETKSVAAGYGRNYLINRGLAVLATDKALERIKRLMSIETKKKTEEEVILLKSLDDFGALELVMHSKANAEGHLFGAIRVDDIMLALKEKNLNLKKEHVLLKSPIKEIGEHQFSLSVGDKEFKFKLTVLS